MASTGYRTLRHPVTVSIEERRSVFECWLRRVDTEEAARAVVAEARTTHWDARHHCSAWVLGPDGAHTRSNDDGEPAGTAGLPMLEVLSHSGLRDVVAVVTRWFGGTLLGTGGLVRAYGDAVRSAVAQAQEQPRELRRSATVRVGHAEAGRLEHDLRAHQVVVTHTEYAAAVTLHLAVPVSQVDQVAELVSRLTAGLGQLVPGDTSWSDVDVAGPH